MKRPYFRKCSFGGFIAMSVVSVSVIFYEMVFMSDIKQYYRKSILFNANRSDGAGFNIYNATENNTPHRLTGGIFGLDVNKVPVKHKCYHLNWTASALTRDVLSKCGFITIGRTRGRMGNNMFQIAALFGTAYKLDMIPIIRPTFPLLNHYNLPNVMNITLKNEMRLKNYKESSPVQTNFINITLSGLGQSWKFFDVIEGDIRKLFTQQFKRKSSLSKAVDFTRSVSNCSYQHVGVHIRRTDVQRNRVKHGEQTADIGYFKRAMAYFKAIYEHVHFIILSDDIGWAKRNLRGGDIFYSPFRSATDDLALLSICDHTIITYGTFGWWGAWLANGTTVFFCGEHKSGVKRTDIDDSEYLIKDWIGIS